MRLSKAAKRARHQSPVRTGSDRRRGQIEAAERILGLKRRNIQRKAATGVIPGAIKLGRSWTFDLERLHDYLKVEGQKQCQQREQLPYKTFPQQFYRIVKNTTLWARKNNISFRPFRFHDLRHLHAVNWLKDRRSIYDLRQRLGHTSVKVTEIYCEFLTAEEERIVKGLAA